MSEKNPNFWNKSIDKAMTEIDEKQSNRKTVNKTTFYLPGWIVPVSAILLVILMIKHWPNAQSPHNFNSESIVVGPRISLLMIAENIDEIRVRNNQLPEELPGPLGEVLDVRYNKIDNKEFVLEMDTNGKTIQLLDKNRDITFREI